MYEDDLMLTIFGPVTLHGAIGPIDPDRIRRSIALVTYLHLHGGMATTHQFATDFARSDGTPWQAASIHAAMSRTRRWLGETPDGRPRLTTADGTGVDPKGAYRLTGVTSDWAAFCALTADLRTCSLESLCAALTLARGRPLDTSEHPFTSDWADLARETIGASVTYLRQVVAARTAPLPRRCSTHSQRAARSAHA